MTNRVSIRWQGVLLLAPLLLWLPVAASAESPVSATRPAVLDVELGPQATWSGTLVDRSGMAIDSGRIVLADSKGPLAEAVADSQGRFVFRNVRPGLHALGCGGSWQAYRVWRHGTAPPSAVRRCLVVAGGPLVRGRNPTLYGWMSEHWVLSYTGIAAAIAVPVILVGNHQAHPPASP